MCRPERIMWSVALLSVTVLSACAYAHEYKHTSASPTQHGDHESVPVIADVPSYIVNPDGPLTRGVSGSFRGSWMTTRRGRRFQAYRGIRYAEPPIGALRFQPPKLKLTYEGEVDASEEGPSCPLPAPPTYYVDEDCLTVNVYTPAQNAMRKLKLTYEGEVDASEEGPACPLPAPPTYYVDEDCLTVNVCPPAQNASGPLPVIFYIHAGGFYAFNGRSDLAGPHYLLDRDVVLVTINYRIGSLGFMSTGDAYAPGNNGMKDQVAALKWVQRNIAAFGGDPNLVTITGCSAGSISVMLHMISPMTKGLFHRGIGMSASPVGSRVAALTHQRHLAVRQAQILNCPTDNSSIIVDCLMTKPWKELGDSLPKFWEFGTGDPVGLWGPVLEPDFGQERYLTINPLDAIKQGKMHTVPFIVSQTTDEFFWKAFPVLQNETLLKSMNEEWERVAPISFMLPEENRTVAVNRLKEVYLKGKKLANDKESEKALGRLYGDSVVGFGVHRLANLMCRHSKHPVWYYEFAYIGNNSHYEDPNGKPQGAAHHDDLIYLFTLSYRYPIIPISSPHSHVVDEMTAIWYNFARYGDPNPRKDTPELGNLSWPAMKPDKRSYLHLGKELVIRENMFEDRFKVWDELYPIQY